MRRKRGSLGGPVKALAKSSPQARHHFTQADQVNQLVAASEADVELGFMARLMALCSLPRSNPGDQHQYQRVNGPYRLILSRTGAYKLPFGNLPRLLLAWISTEAVRTQSRELILGDSLSEFMRALGVYSNSGRVHTRLRNQMNRLFHSSVEFTQEHEQGNPASLPHALLTVVSSGGTPSGPTSPRCGRARSSWARSSSTRSSATPCRWT